MSEGCADIPEQKTLIEREIGCDVEVHGYRVLIKSVELPEKTRGGILYTDQYRNLEKRAYNVGQVLKMGPLAYRPLEKFGGKPFCAVGDWVIYSAYEREEININNHLCFFINDERVYASVPDISAVIQEMKRS